MFYSANSKLELATYDINKNRFVTQAFRGPSPHWCPGYPVPLSLPVRCPCTHAPDEQFFHSSNNTLIAWEPDESATLCVICSGPCAWPPSWTDRFQQTCSEFRQSRLECYWGINHDYRWFVTGFICYGWLFVYPIDLSQSHAPRPYHDELGQTNQTR